MSGTSSSLAHVSVTIVALAAKASKLRLALFVGHLAVDASQTEAVSLQKGLLGQKKEEIEKKKKKHVGKEIRKNPANGHNDFNGKFPGKFRSDFRRFIALKQNPHHTRTPPNGIAGHLYETEAHGKHVY